jgi:hypothetical protein
MPMLLDPLARPLLRGSARRDGGDVVYTCTGTDSWEGFDPAGSTAGLIAGVVTADQAVCFVNEYGPVGELPEEITSFGAEFVRMRSTFKSPIIVRESIRDVLQAATRVKELGLIMVNIRKASAGDAAARKRLRAYYKERLGPAAGLSSIEEAASLAIAHDISLEIAHAQPLLRHVASEPGRFHIQLVCRSLASFCCLRIGMAHLQERVRLCSECRAVFVVEDGRQRFCTPACAARSRYQRFRERHAKTSTKSIKRARLGVVTALRKRKAVRTP